MGKRKSSARLEALKELGECIYVLDILKESGECPYELIPLKESWAFPYVLEGLKEWCETPDLKGVAEIFEKEFASEIKMLNAKGLNVSLVEIKSEIRVSLALDSQLTAENWRQAWSVIQTLRQWLRKKFGPAHYQIDKYAQLLYEDHVSFRLSYADLAQECNERIEKTLMGVDTGVPVKDPYQSCLRLLNRLKVSRKEGEPYLQQALQNLRDNRPAFARVKSSPKGKKQDLIDGPITKDHIREYIRAWKRRNALK